MLDSLSSTNFGKASISDKVKTFIYNDIINGVKLELVQSEVGIQKRIHLRMEKATNFREDEQKALNEHKKNEPEGMARLNIKAVSEWKKQNQELLDKLYAPGVESNYQVIEIDSDLLKNGPHKSKINILNQTQENIYDRNGKKTEKRQEKGYRYIDGQHVAVSGVKQERE